MDVIATTFGGNVVWSFFSQFEVLEGLAVISLLCLCAFAIERSGFRFLFYSPVFRYHLRSPLSRLCAVFAIGGMISYALLVLCNMQQICSVLDIYGWNVVRYPLDIFGFLGGSAMGQNGREGYGALALLIWGLTIIALSLSRGFMKAVRLFGIPSILFLTIVVLLYDPGQMDSQAINLVTGFTYDGISLLSNWFLLTVSLFFTILDIVYISLGRKKENNRFFSLNTRKVTTS